MRSGLSPRARLALGVCLAWLLYRSKFLSFALRQLVLLMGFSLQLPAQIHRRRRLEGLARAIRSGGGGEWRDALARKRAKSTGIVLPQTEPTRDEDEVDYEEISAKFVAWALLMSARVVLVFVPARAHSRGFHERESFWTKVREEYELRRPLFLSAEDFDIRDASARVRWETRDRGETAASLTKLGTKDLELLDVLYMTEPKLGEFPPVWLRACELYRTSRVPTLEEVLLGCLIYAESQQRKGV